MKENSVFFDRLISYCDKTLTALIIILGILLVGVNTVQIILRGFFKSSFLWVLEFSEFLGIWIVLFGASIMFLRDTEVKVTVIVNYFPKPARKVIEIIVNMIGIIFAITLIWGNINYQKYVGLIQPDYLPFSFRVHTFPIYIFGISIIYNCLYIIFRQDKENNKERLLG